MHFKRGHSLASHVPASTPRHFLPARVVYRILPLPVISLAFGSCWPILAVMINSTLNAVLTWLNLGCWAACFWWMHRISSRQDVFLAELKEQGRRVEALSRAEHALIKEVHPQVGEIKEGMQEVVDAVRENASANATAANIPLPRSPNQPDRPGNQPRADAGKKS